MDALNIPTTFLRPEIGMNPVHEPLVRRNLTAYLDDIASNLWDEVSLTLWGVETEEFRIINLDYTIRRVVARAVNQIFVRDKPCGSDNPWEDRPSITWVSW